ncbi:MAG TPA: tol-pal system protein YbgF [Xanthobacteraceae bacterium]|nr:tol-pal system protein YbgF [Xanthobacteraceae bacterium]
MVSATARFIAFALAACLYSAAAEAQLFGQPNDRRQQDDAGDLSVRLDRMENQMRQLTGTIEQLQYQNQQLMQQLSTLQQQVGAGAAPRPAMQQRPPAAGQMPVPEQPLPGYQPPPDQLPPSTGRRGDAFDPNAQPNAPGAPRQLGTLQQGPVEQPGQTPVIYGRAPGQPMDIGSYSGKPGNDPNYNRGQQQAVLPPSNSPKDEYDLAYGYVLRRDYAAADDAFRTFMQNHAGDPLIPQAYYWLGESQFQRQQYNDAAETFLDVYNKYPQSTKAPEALMRLGQSLAAIGKQDAACASLGAVLQKYPKASAQVKATVAAEQKRVRC